MSKTDIIVLTFVIIYTVVLLVMHPFWTSFLVIKILVFRYIELPIFIWVFVKLLWVLRLTDVHKRWIENRLEKRCRREVQKLQLYTEMEQSRENVRP